MLTPRLAAARAAFLVAGALASTMMFGAAVYQRAVDVPNWSADLPASAAAFAAGSLRHANPTLYYATLSVIAVLALLAGAALGRSGRGLALLGAAAVFGSTLVTVIWVLPRNDVLFFAAAANASPAEIVTAAREWRALHGVRLALLGTAVCCAAWALLRGGRGTPAMAIDAHAAGSGPG